MSTYDNVSTPRLNALNKAHEAYLDALVNLQEYLDQAVIDAKGRATGPCYAVEQSMLDVQAAAKHLQQAIRSIEEA